MKKRTKKILALILAFVLIAGLGVFSNALVGNPLLKWLATRTTEKILDEKYADKDFYIERVTYSFKDGGYHAFIASDGWSPPLSYAVYRGTKENVQLLLEYGADPSSLNTDGETILESFDNIIKEQPFLRERLEEIKDMLNSI